jgi:hypothetical protein
LTLLTPRNRCKFHRAAFFYNVQQTPFEQSSRESSLMQGSDSGAEINEASDEDLRGMAS